MKRVATPSKYWLACGLALGLALSGYAPVAAAAKPVRDAVPPPPPTPRVVQPAPPAPAPKLPAMTAEQIVERNVAARGGLKAWRAVNTLSYAGQLDAGGKKPSMLPFTLLVTRRVP